jgi:hypothetical protein
MVACELAFQTLFAACHSRCDEAATFLGGQVEAFAPVVVELHRTEQNV